MRRNLFAIALLIVVAAWMYARWPRYESLERIERESTSEIGLSNDDEGRPVATADAQLDSAASVARLAEVQAVADTATAERVAAPALLRAGLLKLRLHRMDIDSSAAKRRPQDFFHNEIAGGWLYNGADFDSIVRRFPRSTLVDDANYAKLFLVPGGECEGYTPCHVAFAVRGPVEFLQQHPASPHAVTVVATINRRVGDALREVDDLNWSTESFDPGEVRDHLRHYDSVAKRLPSPARDSAAAFLKRLSRPRPKPQEFVAADIPPEVRVACNLAEAMLKRSLVAEPVREEGTFGDSFRGITRTGCRLNAAGKREQLDSNAFVDDAVRREFERNRWVMDPRYDAAGPDGSTFAMRLGFLLCIVGSSYSDSGGDVRLECFRDNDRPPQRR